MKAYPYVALSALAAAPALFAKVRAQDAALSIAVAPTSFREDRAAVRGRLSRAGSSLPALTVRLQSTDARVVVPATVEFAAGARQASFPVRVVDDNIINNRASPDGFSPFRINVSGTGVRPTGVDLRILDDEPFKPAAVSPVVVSRLEVIGESRRQVRLVFSGRVLFNATRAYGTPFYLLAINQVQARAARVAVVNPQVLLITFDRDFAPGDTIGVAAYNLSDLRGLPLEDQIRVTVVPVGPRFAIETSRLRFRENAGANASRVTLGLAYAVSRPLTFQLRVNALVGDRVPTKISAPASVTIPAGARAVSFAVAAIDNTRVDGDILNSRSVVAPYPTPPTSPTVQFEIVDDERAPASDVRVLRGERRGQGVVRLTFSGSVSKPFYASAIEGSFRVRIGNGRPLAIRGNVDLDSSGTIANVLTGVNLPDEEEITILVSGLRDSNLAVIPDFSITLPPVPSNPAA